MAELKERYPEVELPKYEFNSSLLETRNAVSALCPCTSGSQLI